MKYITHTRKEYGAISNALYAQRPNTSLSSQRQYTRRKAMHHCHKLYTQEPEYITIYITLIIHAGEKHHGIHHTNNRLMITSTVLLDGVYKLSDTTIHWNYLDCVLVFPPWLFCNALCVQLQSKIFDTPKGNYICQILSSCFHFCSSCFGKYKNLIATHYGSKVQFVIVTPKNIHNFGCNW